MSIRNRLTRLEQAQGIGTRYKYLCAIFLGWERNTSEDGDGQPFTGYKIQPCAREFGGTGEKPFILATKQELDDFGARPDVELTIIELGYTDDD